MKTISIQQPWASLLGEQVKTVELRGWSTDYRGLLLVRASKNSPVRWENDEGQRVRLPTECLLFVGELVVVREMRPEDIVPAMSAYWNDENSWQIRFCYYVRPVPAAGKLKLYGTPESLIERLPDAEVRNYHPPLTHRTRHPFRASVHRGELMLVDSRTGEQAYITVHLDHAPPLAWVFVPMFAFVGGVQGGTGRIKWQEVAAVINQGITYQSLDALPVRAAQQK
jgi:hypothetical protein